MLRLIYVLFLMVSGQFLTSCVYAVPSANVAQGKILTDKLAKVDRQLTEIHKSLNGLRHQVEHTFQASAGLDHELFLKKRITRFSDFLRMRIGELEKGLKIVAAAPRQVILETPTSEQGMAFGRICLMVAVSFALGFLVRKGCARLLRVPEKILLRRIERFHTRRSRLSKGLRLFTHALRALLPLFVGSVVQLVVLFSLEPSSTLQSAYLFFVASVLIWQGGGHLRRLLLTKTSEKNHLFGLNRTVQISMVRHLQTFLFLVVGAKGVELFLTTWGMESLGVQAVLAVIGGVQCSVAVRITQTLKNPILRVVDEEGFRAFVFLRWFWTVLWQGCPLFVYLLFVFNPDLLEACFWDILLDIILIPLVPVAFQEMRRLRMAYLRNRPKPSYQSAASMIFRDTRKMKKIFLGLLYGVLLFIFFDKWNGDIFVWLRTLAGERFYQQLWDVGVLAFGAWLIVHLGDQILRHYLGRLEKQDIQARLRTFLVVSRTILRFVVWVPFALVSLSILGYNIGFVVTSLGIVSVTLTFGLQSFVKDFVAGFFILFEKSIMVGDHVDLDGRMGIVEWLSLRTVRIRGDNGVLQTIPFGSITVIGNKSSGFVNTLINLSVAYDESPEKVAKILDKTYQILRTHPIYGRNILGPLEQRGIVDVTDYSAVFQARFRVAPGEQDRMRRIFTMTLKKICDEAGVKVPSPPYLIDRNSKTPSLTLTEM